ncbi:hypothetical protein BASA50_010865 [Batrachochytrium salamandrivorans]|uniref:FAM192A/Fyv6 N-terminal domain-containing protein n=1 Tax=Batrachochytrium salamandrivorans TaxID=1357716 RepID=A0ABQ8EX88_9FUNG|nr:hypothetical protein BASA60_006749 [Batrachochytrium salamandrivorans]KAH6575509.1 hypothetical protein BASA62_001879 [Batrachochytrium salamandrivorans]KAH6588184.1 hypothetical protein BASA50_010865 [Batrachochytrium salamandrivorans]KAH6600477.1 hypothetical protein BASA61_002269 [Batrachochytrium salamandrivorans]KAJ1336538.1 hypothetical protein BSLG_007322 [Batrachochytrium salamandrivorans]
MSEGFFSSSSAAKSEPSAVALQIAGKFVTEAELSNLPESARLSEAEYDPRPLFEKLAEKKRIQEEEFAEKMRFANQIKCLDPDEVEFLTLAESEAAAKDKAIRLADQDALESFRNSKMTAVPPRSLDIDDTLPLQPSLARPIARTVTAAIDTQKYILLKGVKRKAAANKQPLISPKRKSLPSALPNIANPQKAASTSTAIAAMVVGYGSSDEDE